MPTEENASGTRESGGRLVDDDHSEVLRYDVASIRLHWLTAAVVLLLWCLGQTIDWFAQGVPRMAARSTHISLGAALGLVLCYRIWWRSWAGRRLPPAGRGTIQQLSTLVHYLLYLLLIAVVVLGVANVWARGDNIFNLFAIPAFDPGNKALRRQIENLHGLGANILLFVAGAHAAAALIHHFFLKDAVLRRMWTRRK